MQVLSHSRRVARSLGAPLFLFRLHFPLSDVVQSSSLLPICRSHHTSFTPLGFSFPLGSIDRICSLQHQQSFDFITRSSFSSGAGGGNIGTTETVKELYDKIFKSIAEQRTAPPNAWLWSFIEKCSGPEDIKLLFETLRRLRVFRLSNLRIHENFNCALCQEVTKACVRVGAIDYGKKALLKHNVYGLTPSLGSANHLLSYAKQKNNVQLMIEIMKLVKKNDLPLQPGTADIVLSVCYHADNWELMSKYAKKFVKAGVKLRQHSFDMWMDFAVKVGDTNSLWKIEKTRSEMMKQHTLTTGFSCVKGFLLERKHENAAATIHLLDQTLSEVKRPGVLIELQKLVSEWPMEAIKRQKEEKRKELAAALQDDIAAMLNDLLRMGLKVNVKMESLTLTRDEAILT